MYPGFARLEISQSVSGTSDLNGDSRLDKGDLIAYSFTVTNTGSLTVSGISVVDTLLTRNHVGLSCPSSVLLPDNAMTCSSGWLTVTAFQSTAGYVINYSTAHGLSSTGASVNSRAASTRQDLMGPLPTSAPAPAPYTVKPHPVSRLNLDQYVASVADRNSNGYLDATDSLVYGFKVTNTGARTVSAIVIVDQKLSHLGLAVTCPGTVLDPGTSMQCLSARQYVTAYLAKSGVGENFAYAVGVNSSGREVRSNGTDTTQGRKISDLKTQPLAFTGLDGPSASFAGAGAPSAAAQPDASAVAPAAAASDSQLPLVGIGLALLVAALSAGLWGLLRYIPIRAAGRHVTAVGHSDR